MEITRIKEKKSLHTFKDSTGEILDAKKFEFSEEDIDMKAGWND